MTIAHTLSLFLTGLVFYVSGKHIFDLFRPARRALHNRLSGFVDLVVFGIFIGSLGDYLDNKYWGLAWFADGLSSVHPKITRMASFLFEYGVIANIPFRQFSDLVSNYCFALAFIKLSEELKDDHNFSVIDRKKYHRNLFVAAIVSALVVCAAFVLEKVYG